MTVLNDILDLKERMQKDIIGQSEILDRLLIGLLSNGNLLVEGLPGLAKTRAIKALASNLEGTFNRIQFTPDLVSGDITGKNIYDEFGKSHFEKGPIFANFVLADEINRAPSKSQNALLEAMEERQVTASGQTLKMPDLFLVMATMNPSTQQGTFPLPEAQKDRFLMHVTVHYPDEEAEGQIVRLVRDETNQKENKKDKNKKQAIETPQEIIFKARAEIDQITVPDILEKYMVDLVFATRYPQKYTYELRSFIKEGASPRASIGLDKCIRTHAWLNRRSEANVEDLYAMIKSVLRHRIIRGDRAIEHSISTDDIVDEIIELVDIPEEIKTQLPPEKD